ncbi:MAG: Crp/Fnr family transcriptional regulator [Bacteroidales bacterium]|nr:Crp/Fnr family transcriptional regulator [Bacteroidales bacterium]
MFETLLNLPLFQGISKSTLASLVEKYPFHFLKYEPGTTIIEAGDACTHLRFVVSGSVKVTTSGQQGNVVMTQIVDAPEVIAPDYLFGRTTQYPSTVTAAQQCGVLQIQKTDYVNMLQAEKILLFNILNYLSRNSQNRLWEFTSRAGGKFSTRLAILVYELTTRNSRSISIAYKQKELCTLLGVRRTTLMAALTELQTKGVITFTPNVIQVLDRRALIDLISL